MLLGFWSPGDYLGHTASDEATSGSALGTLGLHSAVLRESSGDGNSTHGESTLCICLNCCTFT